MPNKNKYVEDFKRANYDTIKILTPKGTRDKLKAEADRRGLPSVNALLNLLISSALHIPADPVPTDPAGTDGDGDSLDQSREDGPEE